MFDNWVITLAFIFQEIFISFESNNYYYPFIFSYFSPALLFTMRALLGMPIEPIVLGRTSCTVICVAVIVMMFIYSLLEGVSWHFAILLGIEKKGWINL